MAIVASLWQELYKWRPPHTPYSPGGAWTPYAVWPLLVLSCSTRTYWYEQAITKKPCTRTWKPAKNPQQQLKSHTYTLWHWLAQEPQRWSPFERLRTTKRKKKKKERKKAAHLPCPCVSSLQLRAKPSFQLQRPQRQARTRFILPFNA